MRKLAMIACLGMLVLGACSKHQSPTNHVEGNYELFDNLRPHSLGTVHIDVYEDFTCPACQQFANDFMPPLIAAYGDRVALTKHYLVGSTSPVSAQVLYDVASRRGQAEEAAKRLFAARLDHHNALKNGPVVAGIADTLGLRHDYDAAMNDPATTQRIRAQWNDEGAKITFFPSLVIEHVLLTDSNPANLDTIINSLLIKPMVHVSITQNTNGAATVKTDQADRSP